MIIVESFKEVSVVEELLHRVNPQMINMKKRYRIRLFFSELNHF
jgi:hypothetical protein